MLMSRKTLLAASAAAVLTLAGTPAGADEAAGYSVKDLLQPCVEGDNDSRGGAVLELECEQYIQGFTHLYIRMGQAEKDKVCFPAAGNRADEVRWAFMRWAHENFEKRDMTAIDGLLATVKTAFKCK